MRPKVDFDIFFGENLDGILINCIFVPRKNGRTHSSMVRIMDSGSIDWGATPHGCTI